MQRIENKISFSFTLFSGEEFTISSWNELMAFVTKLQGSNQGEKVELRMYAALFCAQGFPAFMNEMLAEERPSPVGSPFFKLVIAFGRGWLALRPIQHKLDAVLNGYLEHERAFSRFIVNVGFISGLFGVLDPVLLDTIFQKIINTPSLFKSFVSVHERFNQCLRSFPEKYANAIFNKVLEVPEHWNTLTSMQSMVDGSLALSEGYLNLFVAPLLAMVPKRYRGILLGKFINDDATFQAVTRDVNESNLAGILYEFRDEHTVMLIDKFFADINTANRYVRNTNPFVYSMAYLNILKALRTDLRRVLLAKLESIGISVLHEVIKQKTPEYFMCEILRELLAMGANPNFIPAHATSNAFNYFCQEVVSSAGLTPNVVVVIHAMINNAADPINNFKIAQYALMSDLYLRQDKVADYFYNGVTLGPTGLSYVDGYMKDDHSVVSAADKIKSLTAIFRHIDLSEINTVDFNTAWLWQAVLKRLSTAEFKFNLRVLVEPTLQEDHQLIIACMIYVEAYVRKEMQNWLGTLSRDTFMVVTSKLAPHLDLDTRLCLLDSCFQQQSKFSDWKNKFQFVSFVKNDKPVAGQGFFNYFLSSERLAVRYSQLKRAYGVNQDVNAESKLNRFREFAAPHLAHESTLFSQRGKRMALHHVISDSELVQDLGNQYTKP